MGRIWLAVSLLGLSLQGCWVPQIVEGVRPELFPSAAPESIESASLSTEAKQVILGTTLISLARRTAQDMALSIGLAAQRQALENHVFYNVKQNQFQGWRFEEGLYRRIDSSTGTRYRLSFLTRNGQPYTETYSAFDILGQASYGAEPLPAQDFPQDVTRFVLSSTRDLESPDNSDDDDLKLSLNGEWPVQIPLRAAFTTVMTGTGQVQVHPAFTNLSLNIDGTTRSDGSLLSGQLSFAAEISGQAYNGFGQFDAQGFNSDVVIEQNGVPVLSIMPREGRWDVVRNDVIEASVQ